MTEELTDTEFALLGERMKNAWDESSGDASVWDQFSGDMKLRSMCVRWSLTEEGDVDLVLEEHVDTVAAFWSSYRNDGSVTPVRAVGWRWTRKGWVQAA